MKKQNTIIIARHGNTFAAGEVVRRVGITDLPLVESGVQQAEKLAQHLLAEGLRPSVIFTSELQRTQKMAEIFCEIAGEQIPTFAKPIFNEINYGIDENQPEEQVAKRLGEKLQLWEEHGIPPEDWHINVRQVLQNWQDFLQILWQNHAGESKIFLVITSNGIARFAPKLCANFAAEEHKYSPKLATGAFGIIQLAQYNQYILQSWNIRP
jgi:2,3-bisphosphoglycerate-dependent phosphoglycerate mutase